MPLPINNPIAGPEHVGFGADWDGGGVTGMEDVSHYYKITEALLKAGYSERDLANVWSGNALRLLRNAEHFAKSGGIAPSKK